MMREFEKLNELYTAIKDIDRIYNSNSKEKIDEVANAIKNIDKSHFDKNIQDNIILGYRDALLLIYKESFETLHENINTLGGLTMSENNVLKRRPIEAVGMVNSTILSKEEEIEDIK